MRRRAKSKDSSFGKVDSSREKGSIQVGSTPGASETLDMAEKPSVSSEGAE